MNKVYLGMQNNSFKAGNYKPVVVFSNSEEADIWAKANNGYVMSMTVFDSYANFDTMPKNIQIDLTKLVNRAKVKFKNGQIFTIKNVSAPSNEIVSVSFYEYTYGCWYYTDGIPVYCGIDNAIVEVL